MTTWYKTSKWKTLISPVKVSDETPAFITIDGIRTKKSSNYSNYFPTYREAYEFLLSKKECEIVGLKARLKSCESDLADFVREWRKDKTS